ncbi:MAG: hypothetical protein AB1898_10670 [Acidobacteriota bacterium]
MVIDARIENIQTARTLIGESIECICEWYDPSRHTGFDVVVIPLSLTGNREALYRQPSAPAIFFHDWIWRRRGRSAVISFFLLKRLNLVRSSEPSVCSASVFWPRRLC